MFHLFPVKFPMCVDNLQLPQRSPNVLVALMQRSIPGRGWSTSSCCAMVTCVVEVSWTTSGLSQQLTACTYGVPIVSMLHSMYTRNNGEHGSVMLVTVRE